MSACPLGYGGDAKDALSSKGSESPPAELSGKREVSTIPSADGSNFLYPSEKQFFTSATAKGHELDPQDMSMVIAIHNAVNERTWQDILKYETGQ